MTSESPLSEPAPLAGGDAPSAVDERCLHPAATVIVALRHARSAGFGAFAVVVSQGPARGGVIVLAILVVAAVAALLHWRTTRYAVVDGALRLRTGVLAKREQVIPGSRISALDTSRGILQRMFGVVAVQVQTAGGKKDAELVLRAVSFDEAERLRRELGHRAATDAGPSAAAAMGTQPVGNAAAADSGTTPAPPTSARDGTADAARPVFTSPSHHVDEAPVVYSMSPRELVLTALTSPSIAIVGAALAAAFSFADDALPKSLTSQLRNTAEQLTVAAALSLLAAAILLAAVVSVAGTIVLYGGFRVTRDERRIRVRRGLLTERIGTIPVDRIHGVRVVESPLRQLLGYASVEAEVAGYANQNEVTRTLIPLVRRRELGAVLERVVPELTWPDTPLECVPSRGRRRYVTRSVLVWGVPVAAALVIAPIGPARLLAIAALLGAAAYGRIVGRDAGWHLDGHTLTLRWRSIGRTTLLAAAPRLQRTQMSVSPLQRRAALSTFGVRLSSARHAQVRHVDAAVAHELLGRAGRRPG